ncbi:Holo-[acyl-carrier-protein] synthase [Corynebacterium afermentans subsp. afermentans]|uniref:Holo-[acyl-carrier-protein] synthase n=1 Tax=Corynebacterium afermentans TaxID=38286 RepID=A0A9X8NAN8_9CORY|nr:holo-ACP synthase [Corynebacterium afermentans]OAA16230.1 holo-ACP synthase [Corynebacterium afermentans subsp. afermentans]WJY56086.1 Holo-[acyl-carrier-protein] synthase [Corynebacterium afermentans subsp. afermentans]SIP95358.1 holo-[acyl-carrier protein] synthase [Corynebacterium afermentans]
MHIGTDLVHIPGLAQQMKLPGSTFMQVFTDRERRECAAKPDPVTSLAGRWAVKEAYVKAWASTRFGRSPQIAPDDFNFAEVEVVQDAFGRPAVQLHGRAGEVGPPVCSVSISHDGDYAVAVVAVQMATGAGRGSL